MGIGMQPITSFDPGTITLLGAILAEIEAEHAVIGLQLDDATRELLAQKLFRAASRGVFSHDALKACALAGP